MRKGTLSGGPSQSVFIKKGRDLTVLRHVQSAQSSLPRRNVCPFSKSVACAGPEYSQFILNE